jgi:hypothetical protein
MIKLLKKGSYRLIETKAQTKLLILDEKDGFAWINAEEIGELLVASHPNHPEDCTLARGEYRLYDVEDEPDFTDLQHLELAVGEGEWQGYLLLTGLPSDGDRRRIVPTKEVITPTLDV